jgi:hypothetical protein
VATSPAARGFLYLANLPRLWIARRVDALTFLDDETVHQQTTLHLDLTRVPPQFARDLGANGHLKDYDGLQPVPLSVVRRGRYAGFDVHAADGDRLDGLTSRAERALAADGFLAAVAKTLPDCPPETRAYLRRLVTDDVPPAWLSGSDELRLEVGSLPGGARLVGTRPLWLMLRFVVRSSYVTALLDTSRARHLLTFSEQRPLELDRSRGLRAALPLGLPAPGAKYCRSYHLTATAPAGLTFSAVALETLVVSRRAGSDAVVYPVWSDDRDPRTSAVQVSVAPSRDDDQLRDARLVATVRPAARGLPVTAFLATLLSAVVVTASMLGFVLSGRHVFPIVSSEVSVALLLLFPALLATILAVPSSHEIARLLLAPVRAVLAAAGIATWFAAILVALGWQAGAWYAALWVVAVAVAVLSAAVSGATLLRLRRPLPALAGYDRRRGE